MNNMASQQTLFFILCLVYLLLLFLIWVKMDFIYLDNINYMDTQAKPIFSALPVDEIVTPLSPLCCIKGD